MIHRIADPDISNVFLQCTLATVKDRRQKKKRRGKKWEEVRRLSHRVRARVCVYMLQGGRDREKTRDDDARFNQQFVLILVGAVSPLGLCSPLFLSQFSVRPRLFLSCTQSSYPRLSFALMFFYALRAPPDLFPMSPTLILWPWI
jgi:hypothetical protein